MFRTASSVSPLSEISITDTSQSTNITKLESEKNELMNTVNKLHADREEEKRAKEAEIERLTKLVERLEKANADLAKKREIDSSSETIYDSNPTVSPGSSSAETPRDMPYSLDETYFREVKSPDEQNTNKASCNTPTSHELLSQAVRIISKLRREIKIVKSEKRGRDKKNKTSKQIYDEVKKTPPNNVNEVQKVNDRGSVETIVVISPLKGIMDKVCVDTYNDGTIINDLKSKTSDCEDCLSPEEKLSLQSQALKCLQEDEAALQRSRMGFSSTPRAGNGKNKGVISFFGCMFESICPG